MNLTKPQQRLLAAVRASGERTYNGRVRKTVEALKRAGLVTFEYDLIPQVKGNGIEFAERFIVRPV
jgi:hypothetical protein